MSADLNAAAVAQRDGQAGLVAYGTELVELSERFYRGLFVGMVVFVGLAAVAALALLPLRNSASPGGPPVTIAMTALLAAATPFAVWRAADLYHMLRSSRTLEITLVLIAAALVAYPLRSELWWPSCALVMLVAILAPLQRTLAYCLVILLTNLAAHVIAGDLSDTPAVAIVGLWIGYPFWAATFSVIGDRFAAHVMRIQTSPPAPPPGQPIRVRAWTGPDPAVGDAGSQSNSADRSQTETDADGDSTMSRLTARQLQIVALLVDGLRYREVGACLSISERQVQRHVGNAIARAGVRTANELVAAAVAEGLAPPRPRRPVASGGDD